MSTRAERVRVLVCVIAITILSAAAAAAGGGGDHRCHCPCRISCAGGGECDCQQHPNDCHRCICTDVVTSIGIPGLDPWIESADTPGLRVTTSPWFGHTAPDVLQAAFGATMSDTGQLEWYRVDLTRTSDNPLTYAPSAGFNQAAFIAWKARVSPQGARGFSAGYKSDPAGYSIIDGYLPHLTEPLTVSHAFKKSDGSWIIATGTNSTLESELTGYLDSATGGIPDDAFVAGIDPTMARVQIYSIVDTADLLIKAGNFAGALGQLDNARI